jgi:putative restriction endonuclease
MAVWWVFQNESFERSRKGGYLWAPLVDKRGNKKNHWEYVDQVKKGDVVLSSKDRHLVALSVAKKDAYRANQPDPEDAKLWNLEGRRVDVAYVDLDPSISVDDLVNIFNENNQENSPLDKNGRGKVGYLFPVSPSSAKQIFDKIDQSLPVEELISEGIASENSGPANTTNKRLMDVRLGQDKFRKALLKFYDGQCALTGVNESDLLIASHIKPWSVSNDFERLDLANGILLEAGIDRLFDKGFISFEQTGKLIISSKLSMSNIEALGITSDLELIRINPKSSTYLDFHKNNLFKR